MMDVVVVNMHTRIQLFHGFSAFDNIDGFIRMLKHQRVQSLQSARDAHAHAKLLRHFFSQKSNALRRFCTRISMAWIMCCSSFFRPSQCFTRSFVSSFAPARVPSERPRYHPRPSVHTK